MKSKDISISSESLSQRAKLTQLEYIFFKKVNSFYLNYLEGRKSEIKEL